MLNQSGTITRNKKMTVKKRSAFCLCLLFLLVASCSEFKETKPEEFYADSNPPKKQVFRWSNGQMPKSFDPAKASAPPETDVVRAIYDGLTETETKTLKAIPSISDKWSSSDDHKTWTFILRQDAKWSNGDSVTAYDFVASWKRLARMGEDVTHHELLKNIVGMKVADEEVPPVKKAEKTDIFSLVESNKVVIDKDKEAIKNPLMKTEEKNGEISTTINDKSILANNIRKTPALEKTNNVKKPTDIGVKAVGKYKLVVSLIKPDKSFPELVAHPIFRPVFAGGKEFVDNKLNASIVTSGAFRIISVGNDGITLDKADYYYNKENIKLERVQFIPSKDAESALKAYKDGEVDAVTNAQFEPLALKLLTPYIDFQRRTHSALNFYEFNRKKEPFNDRRVRQALSISIDRKRLTEDEMEGATKPAFNYLPFNEQKEKDEKVDIEKEIAKAKTLLETAGYEDGNGFPTIQLVINRNNIQQKIAKSIAKMWKDGLNVDTNIIVKEFDELENLQNDGNFDMIRRGVVLPTSDETANMLAIFSPKKTPRSEDITKQENDYKTNSNSILATQNSNTNASINTQANSNTSSNSNISEAVVNSNVELKINTGEDEKIILTEEEAVLEVPAIPLYFPTSYSLVKPYVLGFEMNTLDAPLLKDVRINNNWQPKKPKIESQN